MTPREQQAQQTYEHILQTAEMLLETYSYDTLSVNDICEKAGISKGGFYHHFSSKDQLLALLIGRQMERLIHERVAPLLGKKDAITLLNLYLFTGMEYLQNNPRDTLARCWLALSEHKELTTEPFSKVYFKLLDDIVLQGIKEGCIRKDIDPVFCENFLAATYSGIFLHTFAYHGEQSFEDFAEKAIILIHKIIS